MPGKPIVMQLVSNVYSLSNDVDLKDDEILLALTKRVEVPKAHVTPEVADS